jgi:hypothetical protein
MRDSVLPYAAPPRLRSRAGGEAHDIVAKSRAKLKEMQDLFIKEATRNHVLPLDDRRAERFNPAIAGRPDLMASRVSLTVFPGMTGMMRRCLRQHQEPPLHAHGPGRTFRRQRDRGDHCAGWPFRRLGAVHERGQGSSRVQLLWTRKNQHCELWGTFDR